MPDYIKAPDGAYLFKDNEVEIIKDELGRPIVTFKSAGATAVKSVMVKQVMFRFLVKMFMLCQILLSM